MKLKTKIYAFIYPILKILPNSDKWGRKVSFMFLSREKRKLGFDIFCHFMEDVEKKERHSSVTSCTKGSFNEEGVGDNLN